MEMKKIGSMKREARQSGLCSIFLTNVFFQLGKKGIIRERREREREEIGRGWQRRKDIH